MKNKLKQLALFGALSIFTLGCKNPVDNIDLQVDADVIHYSAMIQMNDAAGKPLPSNLTVEISGPDAEKIYDLAGKKLININSGIITLGIHPKMEPAEGSPLKFNVTVKGAGYMPVSIPVTVAKDQLNQVINGSIMKISSPPAGAAISLANKPLVNNATSTAITVSTPVSATKTESTTIAIPAATQFKDENGQVIIGGAVEIAVTNVGIKNKSALDLFPGGGLAANDVVAKDGSTSPVVFLPAGFTFIDLTVGGTEVKKFNNPITVSILVDPTYKLLNGQPIAPGVPMEVWSYEIKTGKWKQETGGVVYKNVNNKLAVDFTTDHLTAFTVAQTVSSFDLPVKFNAAWLGTSEMPITAKVKLEGFTNPIAEKIINVGNQTKTILNDLPNKPLTIEFYSPNGEMLATLPLNGITTAETTVDLNKPNQRLDEVFMKITVKCPERSTVITLPDFYLFYKPVGSANSNYIQLGTVKNGEFTTKLLTVGESYDFKATWGSKIVTVSNRLIEATNTHDVTEGNVSAKTLPILIEECNGF